MYNYELYQVFSEGANSTLVVDVFQTYPEALETYNQKNGFLLLGIDAPTAFEVIYARPHNIVLIS